MTEEEKLGPPAFFLSPPMNEEDESNNETFTAPSGQGGKNVPKQPSFDSVPGVSKLDVHGQQMVFTGPVFIGYPLDQALALLRSQKDRDV